MLVNTPLEWFGQTMLLVAVVAMAVASYLNAALKRRLFLEEIGDSMSWREAFEGRLYKLPPDASAEVWRLHVRMRFTVIVLSAAMTTVFFECPHDSRVVTFIYLGAVMRAGSMVSLAYQARKREKR